MHPSGVWRPLVGAHRTLSKLQQALVTAGIPLEHRGSVLSRAACPLRASCCPVVQESVPGMNESLGMGINSKLKV